MIRLIFLMLLVSSLLVPVYADSFDPGQVRVISQTSSTSHCIGDPQTPLCAVETYLACTVRLDHGLCDKIGYFGLGLGEPRKNIRYRILSYYVVRSADIPADLEGTNWVRPGYVNITVLDMAGIAHHCPKGCRYLFVVRPGLLSWELAGHRIEGQDPAWPME